MDRSFVLMSAYGGRPTVYPFDYCLSTKIIIIFYYCKTTCMLWIYYVSGTPVTDLDQGTSELELVPRLAWLPLLLHS